MNRHFQNIFAVLCFCTAAALFFYPGLLTDLFAQAGEKREDRIEILIKETGMVQSAHVFLKDIADITAPGFIREMLEKIDLGASPKPAGIKLINKQRVLSAIQGRRDLPKDMIITCPDRIYVKRLSLEITVQDIRQYVEKRLSDSFKDKEYRLVTFHVRGLEPYPAGKTEFFADPEELVDKKGKLSFFVDIVIDKKKIDRVSVSGLVALYETVLCAKASHEKGETLLKEDVYGEKKNILEFSDNYIKSFESIEGKQLVSGIRQGDCITASLMAAPPLIQKGDIVSLYARNDQFLIVTTGVCREDGFENDVIKVENMNSGKIVRGIIKEKSKVEVIY